MLTLLGIVLAIGLVVDDAIVVLENIYRHIEEGMPPIRAAVQGSREIAFAVVAMTLTLAAVFTPLAFMTGNTGKLFTEFALTVAAAVLVSGFVALTLTPMMCSKMLRHQASHSAIYNWTERFFVALNNGYRWLVTRSLRHRWVVVVIFVAVAVLAGVLFKSLKSELAPLEDRGFFIGIMLAPEGATMDYTTGLRTPRRGDVPGGARDRELLRGGRAGPREAEPGQPRVFLRQPEAVGRAHAQAAGDHGAVARQDVRGAARRALVSGRSAVARPELPQPAGAVRGAGELLRGARPARRTS